jgi:hypothetical protein
MFSLHLSPLLAFWPFASGMMLFWAAAALAPIVIHLWNRRRYREVSWAAMEYLLAAMRRHSRRILVEQWILLAIRTLILILFAVALAQPLLSWMPSLAGALGQGGQTHWVLVVDVSYSMAAEREGKTRFEQAKEMAASIVQQSMQGDGFTLIALADAPQAIIRSPAFDPKDVLEELDALKIQHGGARLASGLAEIETIVAAARDKHRRLSETRVCFFTDLGRTTWEEAATSAVRARISRLAEKNGLLLFDVGDDQTANVALTSVNVRDSLVALNREMTFEVEVQNFGNEARGGEQVELWIDGRRTHQQSVDLRGAAKTSLAMTHRFELPGEHRVEARLARDVVDVDNHRYASVPVGESLNVLCVQGAPGEARHLAIALEPQRNDRPLVRPIIATESVLLEKDLTQYDALFLVNVGRFSRDESAVLRRYVEQGGGLVIFPGDQSQLESYNEQLATGAGSLSPVKFEGLAQTSEYRVNPLGYRHPIVAAFAGHERAGLLTTPIWKYVRLAPIDSTTSQVALALDNGDPAIVTQALGRGRVVVIATAASTQSVDKSTEPATPWTALSTWPSFPPLMQETLAYAIGGRTAQRNLLVGDDLGGVIPNASSQLEAQLQTPDGRTERLPLQTQGEDVAWGFGDAHLSGIYELKLGPPQSSTQLFAMNVNTRESDLERVDPDALPPELSQDRRTGAVARTAGAGGGSTRDLFRYFLGGVLALLLVETVFAWRIGSGAR